MFLSTDDYARLGGIIRVNPPVREARNQAPLWAALADGTIDIIATDHAPHAPAEKTRNDIWTVDCGFPGVETQMPLMLTEVNAGRMSISDYVRWSAANPAKIWGLYPRKGVVQAGAQADLALVDLGRESVDRRRAAAVALQGHAVARAAACAACRSIRWCAAVSSCGSACWCRRRAAGADRSTPCSICRPPRRATSTRPCEAIVRGGDRRAIGKAA